MHGYQILTKPKYSYSTVTNVNGTKYTCTLTIQRKEVGYFEIHDYMNIPSMGIHIDDIYRGKGYARNMIRFLIEKINWKWDTLLYIDTDASSGFWTKCGMIENTNGNGYEKVVTIQQLYNM